MLWIILFALALAGIRFLIRREVAKGDAAGEPRPPDPPPRGAPRG